MAEKEKNVVLNFKMDGQVQYAETLREINAVMNTAAKEYKNHIAAMGKDADMTDKLAAEKKKLEIQMEAAQKRTKMLSDQYEAMSKDTKTTTGQLTQMYGKLLDAEKAEASLQKSLERVNEGLSEQAIEARDAHGTLDKLKDESAVLEAEQKNLTSAFRLQTAELGDNASETEKAELAHRQYKKQMDLTRRAVDNLEKQLEATRKAYGDNSAEVMIMESRLNDARTTLRKFDKQMEQVEDGSKKAKKSLDGVGDGLSALAGALPAAAIGGLVEGMQETNQQLAMLEMQAIEANLALSDFDSARNNFVAVGQDVGQTTEAMGNLVQAGYETQAALSEISEGIAGAIVKYGETFTSEGLAESINTTSQLGEVTGQLTDLLEKEGINVEKFNEKLQNIAGNGDRANYITKTLADQGLSSMFQKYIEMNPEITKNAEAQLQMQDAMSELSVILTPMVTKLAEFTTKVIEWANENPKLTLGIAAITAALGALVAISGALTLVLTPIGGIIAGIIAVIAGLVLVIQNWGSITDWLGEKWEQFSEWIQEILGKIVAFFENALDWIDEKTNGKFKSVTDTIRKFLDMGKQIVGDSIQFIKNSFKNGLDFLKSLVTLDFQGMKDAISNQMGNIKNTISNIWGNVMDFFKGIDLWETGKKIIGGFIKGFKALKIPTPHFSVKGELDLNPVGGISLPKIDIDWRAKGGIFTQPTIFGASNGRLQGAGEAGPEAVLPLNAQTLGDIGRGIAAEMGESDRNITVHVYLDTDQIGESVNNYNAVDALTKVL